MKLMKDMFIARERGRLAAGQLSRRQFMTSMVAAGVAVPTAIGWADSAFAAAPKRGGNLRIGIGAGSTDDTLDPATWENDFTTQMGYSLTNGITEVAADGSLVGDLASGWEATPDAKTWTFELRSGVTFHNGKPLTPEDVISSINHHRGDDSKSAAKGNLASVVDIRKDGNTVIFELDSGNADFPYILTDYHFQIFPDVDGKIDPASGIGTGPYVLESFEPGVRFRATRNPNYYKSDRAWFDSTEILAIVDPTARQNAVMNGSVDVINRVDPKTVALLARAPNLEILEITGRLHYTMPMRVDAAPFDNYHLRMALKLAVKRQELVDKILNGHGALGNDTPISSAYPYYAADLPQREFDADQAAFHYKQSGHSGAIQLSASDAAFAGAVDAAQLVAASAKEAGITIEVVREPADGYWTNVWNKKPWSFSYWNGRATQDWMYTSAYTADTEWNETAWRTTDGAKRFNEVVQQARSELDDAKRRELYFEAQSLINDDGGAIVPMFANFIMALNKKLAHEDNVGSNWTLDGQKAAERWWMA